MRMIVLGLLAAISIVSGAHAETFDTSLLTGQWQFYTDAKGPGACVVSFGEKQSLSLSEACATDYPGLADAARWSAKETTLSLLNKDGSVAFDLDIAGPDTFTASIDGSEITLVVKAEDSPPNKKQAEADALSGTYVFNRAKGKGKGCEMKFKNQGTYDQYQVEVGSACEAQFSFVIAISGWEPMGKTSIRLIGAEGSTMVDFKPNTKGVLEGKNENNGGRYTLIKQ
jgi:hypothetical protein